MNTRTLIVGALLFLVGAAIVACGDKSSNSPAAPPASPLVNNPTNPGGINNPNANCAQTTTGCQYLGTFTVTNQNGYTAMVGGNTGLNGNVPVGEVVTNPGGAFRNIFGNCGFQFGIGGSVGGGGIQPTLGFGCGQQTVTGVTPGIYSGTNYGNNNLALAQPAAGQNTTIYYSAVSNTIRGAITMSNGQLVSFEAIKNGTSQNWYVQESRNIYIEPVSNNRLNFYSYVNGQMVQAGYLSI